MCKRRILELFWLLLIGCGRGTEPGEAALEVPPDPLPATAPLLRAQSIAPTCPRCMIMLDSLVTIGLPDDTVFPIDPAGIVQGADQLFYVHPLSDRLKVGRYDWAGKLVSAFGGQGEAPGLYRTPGTIAASPDSQLLLVEIRKAHWYDLRTLEATSVTVDVSLNQPSLIAFSDKGFLASTTGGVGMPGEFLLMRQGQGGVTIGSSTSPRTSNTATLGGVSMFRHIVPGRDGGFLAIGWSLAPVAERWTSESGLQDRVELPSPWFERYSLEAMNNVRASGRPIPEVLASTTGAWIDSARRLWTITRVPDPRALSDPSAADARSGLEAHRAPQSPTTRPAREQADAVLAVYEIGDSGATLLNFRRFDERIASFLSDSIVVERGTPEPGLTRFILYTLRFTRSPDN